MFQNPHFQALFEFLKMCSPEGTAKAEPKVVQLFLLSILLCSRKGVWCLKIWTFRRPFWKLENILFTVGWDGWGGMEKTEYQKCPPMLFCTLWVYRTCILYTLFYILKNCHQHSYGFQNLMSGWGWGIIIFEITLCTWVFKYLVPKLSFFFSRI